jgi:hypothetical protein
MDELLKKLPQVIENPETAELLEPIIYPTAWGKWCIAYKDFLPNENKKHKKVFSVVVEPDREPVKIEDTLGTMNEYIGNAPSFEEAINMILVYINTNYNVKY